MPVNCSWHRLLAGFGTGLFLFMAIIQINDPDPLYWFLVYASVAAVMLAAALGKALRGLALVTFGGVLAGLLLAAAGFLDYLQSGDWASITASMQADRPYIESAREFLGLLIAAAALAPVLRRRLP